MIRLLQSTKGKYHLDKECAPAAILDEVFVTIEGLLYRFECGQICQVCYMPGGAAQ